MKQSLYFYKCKNTHFVLKYAICVAPLSYQIFIYYAIQKTTLPFSTFAHRIHYKKRMRITEKLCARLLVPATGLEPVRGLFRGILSPLCLPIPPRRQICESEKAVLRQPFSGDPDGNRTRVTAVKGRCLNRLTTGPFGSGNRT